MPAAEGGRGRAYGGLPERYLPLPPLPTLAPQPRGMDPAGWNIRGEPGREAGPRGLEAAPCRPTMGSCGAGAPALS